MEVGLSEQFINDCCITHKRLNKVVFALDYLREEVGHWKKYLDILTSEERYFGIDGETDKTKRSFYSKLSQTPPYMRQTCIDDNEFESYCEIFSGIRSSNKLYKRVESIYEHINLDIENTDYYGWVNKAKLVSLSLNNIRIKLPSFISDVVDEHKIGTPIKAK